MNCQSCRDSLTALLDDELSRGEKSTVESHLSTCESCGAEYDSMLWAFNLTEKVDPISFNPAIWSSIESQIVTNKSEREGLGDYLRSFFVPFWRPVAATVGAVVVGLILFFSFPIVQTNEELEQEFTEFIQEREKVSRENTRIFSEPRWERDRHGGNPFVRQVSYEGKNPFRE